MDIQAANLLSTLRRPTGPPEQKLTLLSNLKSDIKHYRVPDNAQATMFECMKLAISNQSSINLVTAALSTLGHLVKRLKIQDPEGRAITSLAPRLWPCLLERLGDSRDSHRTGAQQALIDLYPFCAPDVDHLIRDDAIGGSNVRAKESGMQWVQKMHEQHELPFKSFVPAMVVCLEDADGVVRDTAKAVLVDLFRPASTAAKNDLKKQLKLHNVRSSIATQILGQLGINDRPPPETDLAASTRSLPAFDHTSHFAESINSEEARPPAQEEVQMDPIFVDSNRELEDLFRDMLPHFEGRESEENWLLRDRDITKLRKLTRGNAPSEYHAGYMTGLKQLQEGTLKAANSLRTTMMTNGCQLVQELARTLGPAMESMVETYLQNFIKMCAATKSLAQQNGNQTVDTIFQYVSYNVRSSQHVWMAAQDKNKQPRVYAAGWLRTIINRQAGSRTHFEHVGGLDLAEKTIKKCLVDADPKVKESMRATYWAFAKIWPERAETMRENLDDKVRAALERDPHNPNAANVQSTFSQSTPSRTSGARSALRDRIAAAKREKGATGRPNTAMASSTPAKAKSMANLHARTKAMGPPSSRVVSNASVASNATVDSTTSTTSTSTLRPNSLMSGAARRPVKRPEVARPATADPYAARKIGRPETPSSKSPKASPRQASSTRPTTVQSTIARNRVGRLGSPAASPLRQNGVKPPLGARQSARDALDNPEDSGRLDADDLTMVLPSAISRETASSAAKRRPLLESTSSYDTAVQGLGIEDNFTLVMPSAQTHSSLTLSRERPQSTQKSPNRIMSEDGSQIPGPRSARSSLRLASPPVQSPPRSKSPLARSSSRQDTPLTEIKPPSRQGSPLRQASAPVPDSPEVKIYEDPFTQDVDTASQNLDRPQTVLAELPVNETSPPTTSTDPSNYPTTFAAPTQNSPPASPQSKAERLKSRKLVSSGIARIKARTLDVHGFRKLLELVRSHRGVELFGTVPDEDDDAHGVPRLYDDLMAALCDFVSTGPGQTPAIDGRQTRVGGEVKRQAFSVLRVLTKTKDTDVETWNRRGGWAGKVLAATLRARRWVEGTGMVVKDIEGLCADLLVPTTTDARDDPLVLLTTFLDERIGQAGHDAFDHPDDKYHHHHQQQTEAKEGKSHAQATALGLRCVTGSLNGGVGEDDDDEHGTAPGRQLDKVAGLVATALRARDAEVRKAAVECATELYVVWPTAATTTTAKTNGTTPTEGDPGRHGDGVGGGVESSSGSSGSVMGIVSKAVREKERFWSALEREKALPESTKNLIVYFVARREGRAGGR